jgi:Transposase DDE domain group 1
VNPHILQALRNRKLRIARRLAPATLPDLGCPAFTASNIHYELAGRARGIGCGGIGAVHLLAGNVGLIDALDRNLHLLKVHRPYHESDHVLNLAYNLLAGNTCPQDLELLRNDEVYLDALGAARIPDPTTAGDFCRRFDSSQKVLLLMETINEVRLGVWKKQAAEFFEAAIVDADGTMAPTTGECKQGMEYSYDGQWGYHPLVISLANTKEPLYLVNRPGNRPSHEQAHEYLDGSIALCRGAGFKQIWLRGDTDFSQTKYLDRWDAMEDVRFIFGLDASRWRVLQAELLPTLAWRRLTRPPKYQVKTQGRRCPANVKERIVEERNFDNLVTQWEDVAEFEYRPGACQKRYRVIVLRKRIEMKKGQATLWEEYRYFFFITNEREMSAEELVLFANERCDQENLIEQLKNGVKAMKMPTGDLLSNWAYMVMAALAWTLKAWMALCLPVSPRHRKKHEAQKRKLLRMEFRGFVNAIIRLPAQIARTGRRIVYRLLSWNPWQEVLVRGVEAWRVAPRC